MSTMRQILLDTNPGAAAALGVTGPASAPRSNQPRDAAPRRRDERPQGGQPNHKRRNRRGGRNRGRPQAYQGHAVHEFKAPQAADIVALPLTPEQAEEADRRNYVERVRRAEIQRRREIIRESYGLIRRREAQVSADIHQGRVRGALPAALIDAALGELVIDVATDVPCVTNICVAWPGQVSGVTVAHLNSELFGEFGWMHREDTASLVPLSAYGRRLAVVRQKDAWEFTVAKIAGHGAGRAQIPWPDIKVGRSVLHARFKTAILTAEQQMRGRAS